MVNARIGVPVFVIVQMFVVHWAADPVRLPAIPDPGGFPRTLAGWHFASDNPADPSLALQLGADQIVDRMYVHEGSATAANVFVAWYQWQQEGSRQPHSPQVCLPASGWVIDRTEEVRLETEGGDIKVNRLSIHMGSQRGAMLYWWESSHRAIADEWAAKLWLVERAVRERRTDGAFVRVFVPVVNQDGPAAVEAGESIARALYPKLGEYLTPK